MTKLLNERNKVVEICCLVDINENCFFKVDKRFSFTSSLHFDQELFHMHLLNWPFNIKLLFCHHRMTTLSLPN